VPILEGMQGRGKSSAIKILCPNTEWYADSSFKIGERDGYTFLQGRWMIELAELKSVLGVDANTSKAFFSSAEDSYIAKYDKHSVTHKRQCIFVGTSNMEEYLRDETGNRRYLPIKCSSNGEWIDLKSLERDRDQLWAEATHLYRLGVKWYPDGEIEENLVLSEQHTRIETDPWDNLIVNFTEFRSEFTLDDLFQTLEIPKAQRSRRDQIRIGRILTRLGFEKIRKRDGDNRFNVYKKTD
jgi:putative DNA primase/helicase